MSYHTVELSGVSFNDVVRSFGSDSQIYFETWFPPFDGETAHTAKIGVYIRPDGSLIRKSDMRGSRVLPEKLGELREAAQISQIQDGTLIRVMEELDSSLVTFEPLSQRSKQQKPKVGGIMRFFHKETPVIREMSDAYSAMSKGHLKKPQDVIRKHYE